MGYTGKEVDLVWVKNTDESKIQGFRSGLTTFNYKAVLCS
jgi:hypothetical protein